MKSKERPWVLTKEGPIHETKKDHEGPKSQKEGKRKKKKIIIIKKKEEDPDQARGHAARISVRLDDMQQGSQPKDMQQDICSYFQQKPLKI